MRFVLNLSMKGLVCGKEFDLEQDEDTVVVVAIEHILNIQLALEKLQDWVKIG